MFIFEDLYEAMVDTELTDGKPTKLIEEDFCSGFVVQLGHGPGCPVLDSLEESKKKVATPGPEWDEAYKVAHENTVGNHFSSLEVSNVTHFHESINSRCKGSEQRFFVFLDMHIPLHVT